MSSEGLVKGCNTLSENMCLWYLTIMDVSRLANVFLEFSSLGQFQDLGGTVGVQDVTSRLWSGSLGTAFSVDEFSVKDSVVACFPFLSAVLMFRLRPGLREGFFVHI